MAQRIAAAALVVALSTTATAQVAILQIQVIEGDGAVHAPGSRSARPLTVQITDETGRAVPAAAVSFHLPDEGPSGAFANGLRTQVVTADQFGRATLRSLRWNQVPGRLQIRIVASKEQARAGIFSFQYIAEPGSPDGRRAAAPHRRRWIAVIALAGGGTAAGVLAARAGASKTPAAAALVNAGAITIGPPSITVGKP